VACCRSLAPFDRCLLFVSTVFRRAVLGARVVVNPRKIRRLSICPTSAKIKISCNARSEQMAGRHTLEEYPTRDVLRGRERKQRKSRSTQRSEDTSETNNEPPASNTTERAIRSCHHTPCRIRTDHHPRRLIDFAFPV